jgi:hypothetical protein
MTPKSLSHRALLSALCIAPLYACDADSPAVELADATLEDELPTADDLIADSQYMREVFEEQEADKAVAVDLADDRQYRFLVNRLRSAGLSRTTAPELFDRVDRARWQATNDLAPRTTERCDMFITPDDAPDGTLGTVGRSSCVDGSDYSLLQVCHFDEFETLLDCTVEEEFGGGITADVVTHTVTNMGFADGVSYHLTNTGEEFYYYVSALTTTAANLRLVMAHPADLNGSGDVQVCLERSTDSGDCDYKHAYSGSCNGNALCNNVNQALFPVFNTGVGSGTGVYDDANLYMPLQSSGTYLVPTGSTVNSARAWLTLKSSGDSTPAGGLCSASFANASYLKFETATGNFKKMIIDPFALDIGNALWPDHCVDHRTAVDLHVEVNLQTGSTSRTYAWNSATSFNQLSIAWGCLPPGTPITLADGMEVPIERVEVGDRVMADDDGGVLTVVDVMEGREDEPLVVVEDSLGHVVEMTATHPVPTLGRGALQARELVVGDRLETDDGVAHVVAVDTKEYDGQVWNLVLGTPEELEARGTATTMVANHVVVGDVRMQGVLKAERTAAAEVERSQTAISPELYVDYVGAQLRALVRE